MLWQLKQIKGFILTETESTVYKLLHDLTLEPGELVSKVYVTLKKTPMTRKASRTRTRDDLQGLFVRCKRLTQGQTRAAKRTEN